MPLIVETPQHKNKRIILVLNTIHLNAKYVISMKDLIYVYITNASKEKAKEIAKFLVE